MEELLNKLIQRGWNMFGREKKSDEQYEYYKDVKMFYFFWNYDKYGVPQNIRRYSLRELVSKESGLWQFCCENGLIPEDKMGHERLLDLTFGPYGPDVKAQMHSRTYEYRLIESALCDEDKLEQFLLENIKI